MDRISICVVLVSIARLVLVNCAAEECFGNICLKDNYDIDIMPNHNRPIVVNMKYDVDRVMSVDTDINLMGVQISLTQTWVDDRISFKGKVDYGEWIAAPIRMYKEPGALPKIWMPRIWVHSMAKFEFKKTFDDQSYLAVEKVNYTSKLHKPQTEPEGEPEGEPKGEPEFQENQNLQGMLPGDHYVVHYLTQFEVYVKCNMDHHKFPFEEHFCNISMTSADLHNEYLIFSSTRPDWNKWDTDIAQRHKTRYFNAEILEPFTYNKGYDDGKKWSTTGFKIRLKRRSSEFFWNYIFPSGLCVVVSWVTFVLPKKNVEGRVAILITMILVLVTIFNGVLEKTPRADSHLTALAIWMLSMFSLVLCAFVAYCIQLILKMGKKNTGCVENCQKDVERHEKFGKDYTSTFNRHKSDITSIFVLASLFVFYLITYAWFYLS